MTREQIVALFARREKSWLNRDAAALAADHAVHGVVVSPTGGVLEGREEIERVYRVWLTAFPDLVVTVTDLLIDGDRAVQLLDVVGTHAGEFLGLAPTGRRLHVDGAFVYTIKDNLIEHERRVLDFTGVLVQVGLLKAKPAPGL
jgi:predicted ester cyclase